MVDKNYAEKLDGENELLSALKAWNFEGFRLKKKHLIVTQALIRTAIQTRKASPRGVKSYEVREYLKMRNININATDFAKILRTLLDHRIVFKPSEKHRMYVPDCIAVGVMLAYFIELVRKCTSVFIGEASEKESKIIRRLMDTSFIWSIIRCFNKYVRTRTILFEDQASFLGLLASLYYDDLVVVMYKEKVSSFPVLRNFINAVVDKGAKIYIVTTEEDRFTSKLEKKDMEVRMKVLSQNEYEEIVDNCNLSKRFVFSSNGISKRLLEINRPNMQTWICTLMQNPRSGSNIGGMLAEFKLINESERIKFFGR